jgi:MFS family permease
VQISAETSSRPSPRTLRALDGLNFFLADVQTGVGPFLAIYLAGYKWNEERVGLALTVGGIAGILAQTPAGAVVDSLRAKRALVGVAVAAVAAGALLTALFPSFWPVMGAQVLIGGTSSVFIPAICAISLGLVGRAAFDVRQGRNQTFNSAGNVTAALSMGLLGYFLSNRSVFFFAVMFHFANAAMLPLLGELLAKGQGRSSMLFMSACVVTTQLVITVLSSWSGRKAGTRGRKPLLLIAFGVLPIRGALYTLTSNTAMLVAIQILDGIGAGIFGVVSVLVIADLTRGTGRFNLTLGAITTAVGIGAALSQVIAGSIVHHMGSHAGFLFLAAVATAAFAILYVFMPETRNARLVEE